MKTTYHKITFIWTILISQFSWAIPLEVMPSMPSQMKMEPENITFACYCEFDRPYANLDTSGCESEGLKAVVGKIIPEDMIISWFDFAGKIPQKARESIQRISQDPLNLTVFTDAAWGLYSRSMDFTGTADIHGVLGACAATLEYDMTMKMPDGRLGEIARTALYLADTYSLPMPPEMRDRFIAIHQYSPPSVREYFRNKTAYRLNKSWNFWIEDLPVDKKSIHEEMSKKLDFLNYKSLKLEIFNQ